MYQILNGKELARKIREELKLKVDKLKENGIVPKLAVILVGDDSASKVYVKNKSKACKDVGVEFEEILLDENTSMERLLEIIEKLNNREDINGILLQSPLPKGLDIQEAFNTIDPDKDVDGFKICKMIRDKGFNFPIIMLTAKIEDKDKIQGLTIRSR